MSSHIMAFHIPYLKHFQELGWETHVACNVATGYETSSEDVKSQITIPYCDHFYNIPFQRSPLNKKNLSAYKHLKRVVDENHFDIIHCHTPVGGAIGRLAARASRKRGTRVFYTAHGFHFYKGAPKKNWLIYYPIEKYLARYTDCLITINKDDYQLAKDNFIASQIVYIPGVGIPLENFVEKKSQNDLKKELGIADDGFLILSVGELNQNKNHEIILRALADANDVHIHYTIAGKGELDKYLHELAEELGICERVHFLGFRNDVSLLYQSADLFIHPSFREGLPVAVMEAMASGRSIVASNIRGNRDLIDAKGGQLCNPRDFQDFKEAILLRKNNSEVRSFEEEHNRTVARQFSVNQIVKSLDQLYFKA